MIDENFSLLFDFASDNAKHIAQFFPMMKAIATDPTPTREKSNGIADSNQSPFAAEESATTPECKMPRPSLTSETRRKEFARGSRASHQPTSNNIPSIIVAKTEYNPITPPRAAPGKMPNFLSVTPTLERARSAEVTNEIEGTVDTEEELR